jgi:hypothetical protein
MWFGGGQADFALLKSSQWHETALHSARGTGAGVHDEINRFC